MKTTAPTPSPRRRRTGPFAGPFARLAAGLPAGIAALAAALVLSALAPAATARAEVLPFYQDLLSQGSLALQRGAHAEAARDLRLAAFGMLEEPPLLVATLARLALAQQPLERDQDLDQTLERLLTIERRFGVWNEAPLPDATRRAATELLLARVPEASLLAIPSFQPLAEEKLVRRLQEMKPAERRRELAAQVARDEGNPRLLVLLGEEELAAGELPSASSRASRALAAGGLDPAVETRARCLRGAALARAGGCAAAVADLERCPDSRRSPEIARDLLACRLQLGQWGEARTFAASLPADLARSRSLARLVREAERRGAEPAAPQAATPPAAPAAATPVGTPADAARRTPPPASDPDSGPSTTLSGTGETGPGEPGTAPAAAETAPAPAVELPPADRAVLAEARRRMASATRAGELTPPLEAARRVADAHPGAAEAQNLVGEIAYRASRWSEAVEYLRRAGAGSQSPELRFYLAVALYESGAPAEAAEVLREVSPRLPATPFVETYRGRILTSEGSSQP